MTPLDFWGEEFASVMYKKHQRLRRKALEKN